LQVILYFDEKISTEATIWQWMQLGKIKYFIMKYFPEIDLYLMDKNIEREFLYKNSVDVIGIKFYFDDENEAIFFKMKYC
jgi:hypothetical protein